VSQPDSGLQAERTALAWTRTSMAVLVNGALLMAKNFGTYEPIRIVAIGLAVAIALSAYLIGLRRQRRLARRPLPSRITPRLEVHLMALSVLVLIVVSAVAVRG
jgi:uncharacterized membrane protein YidH (DUF202 family)